MQRYITLTLNPYILIPIKEHHHDDQAQSQSRAVQFATHR